MLYVTWRRSTGGVVAERLAEMLASGDSAAEASSKEP
jgi:hypothetical protein